MRKSKMRRGVATEGGGSRQLLLLFSLTISNRPVVVEGAELLKEITLGEISGATKGL